MNSDWKTFLFMDEISDEYCPTHEVKRVKFVSKLCESTISKGYLCPRCEMSLMDYQSIIIRKNNKWIPINEYMRIQGVVSYSI